MGAPSVERLRNVQYHGIWLGPRAKRVVVRSSYWMKLSLRLGEPSTRRMETLPGLLPWGVCGKALMILSFVYM